jgi:anti-anti-sigma factor
MSESLELTTASVGGVPIACLRGGLVFGQDLAAIHTLVTSLRNDGHHRVVLDLTGVQAIDSSGLTALLDARKTIGSSRSQIMLLHPSQRVREALAMIRVDSLFEVIADDAELLARLGAREPPGGDVSRASDG